MATTKSLLNRVLRGLREEQVAAATSTLTDEYHLLLLDWLNVAKDEAEEAWDWQALRTTVTVTGVAGQETYTLTAAADSDVDVDPLSRVMYSRTNASGQFWESSTPRSGMEAQVFDVTDANEFRLREKPPEWIETQHLTDNDETNAQPCNFALYRDADEMFFKVWPKPTGIRTWKIRFVIPQAQLAEDSLDVVLAIPERPVWASALVFAMNERGEEIGSPPVIPFLVQGIALAEAIERERTEDDDTGVPV